MIASWLEPAEFFDSANSSKLLLERLVEHTAEVGYKQLDKANTATMENSLKVAERENAEEKR